MSHEATEKRFAVSGMMDKVVGGERGLGLVAHLACGEQPTGPGSSDVGAVGETRVRASPHGSPPAHLALARPG
jgi:hypothetical protein